MTPSTDPVKSAFTALLRLNDWLVDSGEGERWPEEWLKACGQAAYVLGTAMRAAKDSDA